MSRLGANVSGFAPTAVLEEIGFAVRTGRFREGTKLAVIFEGGALRGVVGCGYALALSELIKPRDFPLLVGSSSGGLNAIYFYSDRSRLGLSIYAENATDPRCTSIWRFPNVLNVDWVVDEWIFQGRPFDFAAIANSTSDIFITLTNLDTGNVKYVNARGLDLATLNKVMKATSYAPLLTNASQDICGQRYGDGATADAIPYDKALSEGATHVICLLTRPPDYRKKYGFANYWFERLRIGHHSQAFLGQYFHREDQYNAMLDRLYIDQRQLVPTLIFHPADKTETPSNIETNPHVIRSLGWKAYDNAKNYWATQPWNSTELEKARTS